MKLSKRVAFDTNALLKNSSILRRYSQRALVPKTVFDELDYRKRKQEHQEAAGLALNAIHDLELALAVSREISGRRSNDERIVSEILSFTDPAQVILVSDDTAMRTRARQAQIEAVTLEEFLRRETSVDKSPTPARKQLYDRLANGEYRWVEQVMNGDPDLHFNFYLANGFTPLIDFVRTKRLKQVDFLLNMPGLELDLPDRAKLELTAFAHAAQRRNTRIMGMLLDAGANPYITSRGRNRGNSPALIAAWDGALNVIRWLDEHRKIRVSMNQADNNGYTPLIKAAIKGHADIVRYLLARGVDTDIRDRKDMSALDHAIVNGHTEIRHLIEGAEHAANH